MRADGVMRLHGPFAGPCVCGICRLSEGDSDRVENTLRHPGRAHGVARALFGVLPATPAVLRVGRLRGAVAGADRRQPQAGARVEGHAGRQRDLGARSAGRAGNGERFSGDGLRASQSRLKACRSRMSTVNSSDAAASRASPTGRRARSSAPTPTTRISRYPIRARFRSPHGRNRSTGSKRIWGVSLSVIENAAFGWMTFEQGASGRAAFRFADRLRRGTVTP